MDGFQNLSIKRERKKNKIKPKSKSGDVSHVFERTNTALWGHRVSSLSPYCFTTWVHDRSLGIIVTIN